MATTSVLDGTSPLSMRDSTIAGRPVQDAIGAVRSQIYDKISALLNAPDDSSATSSLVRALFDFRNIVRPTVPIDDWSLVTKLAGFKNAMVSFGEIEKISRLEPSVLDPMLAQLISGRAARIILGSLQERIGFLVLDPLIRLAENVVQAGGLTRKELVRCIEAEELPS